MEFELRTKEESGLVLYMARINHADFVTIQVLVLSVLLVCFFLLPLNVFLSLIAATLWSSAENSEGKMLYLLLE